MKYFLPKSIVDLIAYRKLIYQLIKRDIVSRYQGSLLGVFWSFLFPLTTLAVYAFVFGYVLSPRWPNVQNSAHFTLILFSGLILFNLFSDCISRAPLLIVSHANYVKKVVFPIDLLVWIPIGSAIFHMVFALLAWIGLVLLLGVPLSINLIFIPIVVAPLLLFTIGMCWFLAAIGVFVRDVTHIVGPSMQILLYLGPIIYPREVLPVKYQWLMSYNPVTIPIEQFRNILNFNLPINFYMLLGYTIVAGLTAYAGRYFFEKTRKGFADVV